LQRKALHPLRLRREAGLLWLPARVDHGENDEGGTSLR